MPLLLRGERFFRLSDVQYVDVSDAHLPGGQFVAALRRLATAPADQVADTKTTSADDDPFYPWANEPRPADSTHAATINRQIAATTWMATLLTLAFGGIFLLTNGVGDRTGLLARSPYFIIIMALLLLVALFIRAYKEHQPVQPLENIYNYSFRLNARSSRELLSLHFGRSTLQRIRATPFKSLRLRRLGGWDVDGLAAGSTLMTIRINAKARVAFRKWAQVDIAVGILGHATPGGSTYVVRHCRLLVTAPINVAPARIGLLVRALLQHTLVPLTEGFDLGTLGDPMAQPQPGQVPFGSDPVPANVVRA